MENRRDFPHGEQLSPVLFLNWTTLTVIDLHVNAVRRSLKKINVVVVFFILYNKKGTFQNFLTDHQVNFTTKKVQNGTDVRLF